MAEVDNEDKDWEFLVGSLETFNTMKYIQQNIKPLAFISIFACIGHFFGSALNGAVLGLLIVSAVTLFL